MPTALTALCNCKNVSPSVCLAATGAALARRGLYAADTSCENEVCKTKSELSRSLKFERVCSCRMSVIDYLTEGQSRIINK